MVLHHSLIENVNTILSSHQQSGGPEVKLKLKNISIISIAVVLLSILIVWLTGLLGLWTSGMAYIADNTKDFTDTNGYVMQGEYEVSINLDDLLSNDGKELYNDGRRRIYVSLVNNTGNSNTGGYSIVFKSCGEYSLSGASLVSGIHHKTVGENSFTMDMSAKMTAQYKGKVYDSGVFGTSGLNHKDGDEFAFYIFPTEAYQNGEITLDEKEIVYLTVTSLYYNVWTKK
jgi:hypothetical protein